PTPRLNWISPFLAAVRVDGRSLQPRAFGNFAGEAGPIAVLAALGHRRRQPFVDQAGQRHRNQSLSRGLENQPEVFADQRRPRPRRGLAPKASPVLPPSAFRRPGERRSRRPCPGGGPASTGPVGGRTCLLGG